MTSSAAATAVVKCTKIPVISGSDATCKFQCHIPNSGLDRIASAH
jgi:hypothetical protein